MIEAPQNIDVNEILQRNAEAFGTTKEKVLERSNSIAERFARIKTYHDLRSSGMSLRAIGKEIGGRGHRAVFIGLKISPENLGAIFNSKQEKLRMQQERRQRIERQRFILQKEIAAREEKKKRDNIFATIAISMVAKHYGVKEEQVKQQPGLKKEFIQPRKTAQYIIYNGTDLSFRKVSELVGRADHSTALNAYKTVERRLVHDDDFRERVEELTKEINDLTEATLRIPQREV